MTYEEMYAAGLLGLNKLAVGSGLTEEELKQHLLRKPYHNQTIVNNSVSDATDGYHIRSGKDYGQLADGNLPIGGIPAALAGIAYQQLTGIGDSSLLDSFIKDPKTGKPRGTSNLSNIFGTVGPNAFLQSVDNIEGLRQSGNAPILDKAYKFGGKIHNLFNQPSTPNLDITALGGPMAKGNFTRGKINVEDYSTKVARIQAKKEAEARARAQAEAQARAQQVISQRQQQQAQQQQQKQYQTKMADVYKNVTVDNSGNKGYTGTGSQGRGAYYQTPKYRGQQAAAAIDAKAKSMGVASPVRRTPGSKYGFGL
jgi:hypothetical protein